MSGWNTKKRFWKDVSVSEQDAGFGVLLDGRSLKTPAKTAVIVPNAKIAEAIAAEWDAQGDQIDPLSMPVMRWANAALDKVALQHAEVADMLADYGGTDLLCYRAVSPEALVARQAEAWDPLLDWAAERYNARLVPVRGVMFQAQDAGALERLRQEVHAFSNFELAAFHDLVSLSGSLILGFAAVEDLKPVTELWNCSRLDELWQEEQWGRDEEAHALAETKKSAFVQARNHFDLCSD
ncbi:ATP12 family chaperone protein [Cognatishimia maritima]|uniref:Chaperone required for the assembly of the F1-ATPase n=1 Tax=Cognatishimia maritima TaxID=870908 RepID=A0A1M5MKX6_9RHOB|nr:ATP12 family protein [Cognatishimia maritima]SHG77921.1 Chaperone required for the assembly of the F1-ATPase [Cognatishimia maritima]